jgi:ferredoxin-NADP reductase
MHNVALHRANLWALKTLGRDWLDYIASNTMTEFNRRWNDFVWTYTLKAVVTHIHDEAPGVKTFTLMPNQLWKGMQPGQHVAVHGIAPGPQQGISRYYSATPTRDGGFTITLKCQPDGQLSPWLHQQLQPGSVVQIEQAQGRFCYRQQPKVLLISAGTGITPCYSIINALMQRPVRPDMALYAQFRTADDILFKDRLQQWQNSGLPVTIALSRPSDPQSSAATVATAPKTLDASNIESLYPDFRERDIYLCGPQGFMDKIISLLQDKGFDLNRLHCERFKLVEQTATSASDFISADAEIYFRHLDRHLQLTEADQGKTLMQIAEQHNVPIESGCRQGMCGTCKLTLSEGDVSGNCLGNAVYLCSAYPASQRLVLDA